MLGRVRARGVIAVVVVLLVACALWWANAQERGTAPGDGANPRAETIPSGDASSSQGTAPTAASHPDRTRARTVEPDATRCALSVRVETTAGVPMEGVVVAVDEAEVQHEFLTDATGRAALGDLARGTHTAVLVKSDDRTQEPLRRDVDIPKDQSELEVVVQVDPPLLPVLVVRLRPDAPRERPAIVRLTHGAELRSTPTLRLGDDVVRVPLRPPRPATFHLTATCPGFLTSETDVDTPRTPGDFVVEVPLHAGGVPAWGRVVESDGTPAFFPYVLACEGHALTGHVIRVRADDQGRFAIAQAMVGRSLVAMRNKASCSPWLELTPETRDIEMRLGRGAGAEGTVLDSDAQPAAGARVWIRFNDSNDEDDRWELTADAAGRYRADGIPEAWWFRPFVMYRGAFSPARGTAGPFEQGRPEDFVARGEAHVAGGPGDIFRRDLTAQRFASGRYTIRLRFPSGQGPAATIYREEWSESGSSATALDVDRADPVVTGTGSPGTRLRVCIRSATLRGETEWFVVEDGKTRDDLVVDLRPAARVVAQLVDETGAPVARRGVEIRIGQWHGDSGSGTESRRTDDVGRAELTFLVPPPAILDDPSRAMVFAMAGHGVLACNELGEHPNLRIAGPELARRLRASNDEVVLPIPVLPPRKVAVRAVDDAGAPVAGVLLDVGPEELVEPAEVTSGADGRAEVSLLVDPGERGTERVSFTAVTPFAGKLECPVADLAKDEAPSVAVARLVRQHVRVVDAEGAPIVGAEVDGETTTDASGEADVLLNPSGQQVSIPGYETAFVAPSLNGSTLIVRLRVLVVVAIRIAIPPGAPDRYRVAVRSGGSTVSDQPIDAGGGRTVTCSVRVPAGPCTADVVSVDQLWAAHIDVPAGADSADVTVDRRPLRTVRVQFVDGTGAPIASTGVKLGLTDAPFFKSRDDSTDATGEVRLELPDGRYGLVYARADGRKLGPQYFDVPSDAPVVVRM